MKKYKPRPNVSLEALNLAYDEFKDVLSGNLPLLVKIFRNDLVIPEFETFCDNVAMLYQKLKDNFTGEVSQSSLRIEFPKVAMNKRNFQFHSISAIPCFF